MKTRQLPILLIIVCKASFVFGQLTEESLASAVVRQECRSIASELEKTPLLSEGMKFNGAVCYYRNGDPERALALFREVRQMGAQKQHLATFWEAKCHAAFGQDSLAITRLLSVPVNFLNYNMLSQKEFDNLVQHNEAFLQLKQSLAPHFNGWTSLLAIIAVSGLLIGFVLWFGRSRFSAGEKRLSVVVFSFSLILISYILIWTGYVVKFPYLQNTWQFLTFLVGPSLYFYLKDTFKEEYSFKEAAWHYLIPALSGLATIPFLLQNFGIQTGVPNDVFLIGASPTLLNVHLVFYAIQVFSMTRNEWQVDANIKIWTRIVAWGMCLYTFAFVSYFVLVACSFFNPEWDYAISTVMALGILTIAYMGLVQRRVFSSEPIGHFLPVKKYQTSSLTESASASIKKRMERLLNEEQVFKENELRLADLATYLDISRHQLSQVINEHYGVNFFELINTYRVEHVKRLLTDPNYKNYTVIQIAYEAGFNNKASFNRYFKREIGMTPSAYRIKEGSVS